MTSGAVATHPIGPEGPLDNRSGTATIVARSAPCRYVALARGIEILAEA
jgi:hypothetical protein